MVVGLVSLGGYEPSRNELSLRRHDQLYMKGC